MRATKLLLAIALPVLMTLVIGWPRYRAMVWAQLPPPNPLTAPQAPLSAPSPLQAPVQPQGLPSLVLIPSPPAAQPTPAARVFNCSCFGPGAPTHWMGRVTAATYFAARQAATGACLSFAQEPQSPFIPEHQQLFAPVVTLPQGFEQPNMASAQAQAAPGLLVSSAPALKACSQCTCD